MSEKLRRTMKLNLGPQHPSTHGVLRLVLTLDGEVVKECEPIIGYLHRGIEKMAESLCYLQYLPIVDRVDYLSGFFCSEAYCSAVEKSMQIQVPERAQYIRTLLMEINRITSHLLWLGCFMLDLGASSPFFYCFREREVLLNLLENLTGARMMYNFHCFGGVKRDVSSEFLLGLKEFSKKFPRRIKDYERIITKNPVFLKRTYGIGILNKKTAIEYALTGPNFRASGGVLDLRKSSPYLVYSKLDFDVPARKYGDSWSRYYVRIQELSESLKIVNQCIDWLENDNSKLLDCGLKPLSIKPQTGMYISNVESPRGILSCILYSDGSEKPYRVKWRTGSFYSTQVLPTLIKNHKLPDIMAIYGSLDVIMPEVDR